jgi:hypothetical protein
MLIEYWFVVNTIVVPVYLLLLCYDRINKEIVEATYFFETFVGLSTYSPEVHG